MTEAWRTWSIPAEPTTLRRWQDGRCAWCGFKDELVRDHCHETGLIRGLLCRGCNQDEGRDVAGQWDAWRSGDNPARAMSYFCIYVGLYGSTPLDPSSALAHYTDAERETWWESLEAGFGPHSEWPTAAPWTEVATARRNADLVLMADAIAKLGGVA